MLFLTTSLFIGLGSVAAQVLVPYAAHLSPEATRGRNVGNVMSGLLLGIMLARPISSVMTEFMGWRAIFVFSAAIIFCSGTSISKVTSDEAADDNHTISNTAEIDVAFTQNDTSPAT